MSRQDVYILQQGTCEAHIFGVVFELYSGRERDDTAVETVDRDR